MNAAPHDLDAERYVVGAMLTPLDYQDFLRILREIADTELVAGDFWNPKCRYTFAAINFLLEKMKLPAVDEKQVHGILSKSENPEINTISLSWLYGLAEGLFTTVMIGWYAQRIVDLAKERRLRAAGAQIAEGGDPEQAIALIKGAGKRKFQGGVGGGT